MATAPVYCTHKELKRVYPQINSFDAKTPVYGFALGLADFGDNNEYENVSNVLINIGGRIGNLMDITQEAINPKSNEGSNITELEKQKIFKAILEVEVFDLISFKVLVKSLTCLSIRDGFFNRYTTDLKISFELHSF